jgi:ubiquinol-cytochrome c reductase cytochrome c1 subunit
MMRPLPGGLAAFLVAAAFALPARAQEMPEIPKQSWSFSGPFGTFDLAAAQRGFQIYKEVCSNCHSMRLLHYRDLAGIGLSQDEIRAVAAAVTVPGPLDDQGAPTERPGLPSDVFKSPFPNDKAAQAANGGAIPPDQTLLVNAREGGPDYIDALMQGYTDPPEGFKLQDGLYYNKYFPGHQIRMPQMLQDDTVTYTDGTKATLAQEAHDIATFLYWTSNPEMVQRKQMGVHVVLYLALLTCLTYAVKRKVWADVH